MATSLDYLTRKVVTGLTKEQLERAAAVFIHEGSGFAVSQGVLWLSPTSEEFLKLRGDYIMHGENGPQ